MNIIQKKIAKLSNSSIGLNRKSLQLKRSWDEVAKLIKVEKKKKK